MCGSRNTFALRSHVSEANDAVQSGNMARERARSSTQFRPNFQVLGLLADFSSDLPLHLSKAFMLNAADIYIYPQDLYAKLYSVGLTRERNHDSHSDLGSLSDASTRGSRREGRRRLRQGKRRGERRRQGEQRRRRRGGRRGGGGKSQWQGRRQRAIGLQ